MTNETELKSYVILPGGEKSRTYEELLEAVPEPFRDPILRSTGVGTSLMCLLEYVARFSERRGKEIKEYRDLLRQIATYEWDVSYRLSLEAENLLDKYNNQL